MLAEWLDTIGTQSTHMGVRITGFRQDLDIMLEEWLIGTWRVNITWVNRLQVVDGDKVSGNPQFEDIHRQIVNLSYACMHGSSSIVVIN